MYRFRLINAWEGKKEAATGIGAVVIMAAGGERSPLSDPGLMLAGDW
jgi:hypothetical protein